MKNHIILPGLAIIALLAASCTKELDSAQEEQTSTPITITATYGDSSTKVAYSESGSTISATWETGDQLIVCWNGHKNVLTLSTGAGTATATFTGTIEGTPTANSTLICFVQNENNPERATISDNGDFAYNADNFFNQDGTMEGAAKCNLYYGTTLYGTGSNISCSLGVSTSMLKFTFEASDAGVSQNDDATLTYRSNESNLASASFKVGANGTNTIYMTVPAGQYSGKQELVYASGGSDLLALTLSPTSANFTAGQTYSKSFNNIITISDQTTDLVLTNGKTIFGTGGENTHITIADGATVYLGGVDLTGINSSNDWAGLTCEGDATIVLIGYGNRVSGRTTNNPGIYVPQNHTLTINGPGSLEAESQHSGAGIGGKYISSGTTKDFSGNIVINGGTITASGNLGGAGIGAGLYGSCGNITINGGHITALGEGSSYEAGAGIGSGFSFGHNTTCGNITISDGTVIASGGKDAAGIGTGGANDCTVQCGDITISGTAIVTANGGSYGAGIGTGNAVYSSKETIIRCGNIRINGGTVESTGGAEGSGIGTGSTYGNPATTNSCQSIEITAGITSLIAKRGSKSPDIIGKGLAKYGGTTSCGTITIDGVPIETTSSTFEHLNSSVSGDTWTLTHK